VSEGRCDRAGDGWAGATDEGGEAGDNVVPDL
jgi:hypothetical protein